ncbi:glucan biosynthesis protein G [Alloalcanivorax marinus]|uniref:glucan biosynthesis protein G n=1 Tax=Alloalcanivorax marinus TaxID=1177169 RepID=UPI001EF7BF4E|nr:glucan biosynthesis protein G [Alloalcanivorax marinus]MBM7333906.1 glucan biosynthesis protein G [Alloalcanivorax marinus]
MERCRRGLVLLPALMCWLFSAQVSAQGFGFQDVIDKAREKAGESYQAPTPVPQFLQELSQEQYQGIRFKSENSLWRESGSHFQVSLMSPGLYFKHAVKLNVVDAQGVHDLPYDKNNFTYTSEELARRVPADLGYGGFRLTYPDADAENGRRAFMVFAGASYFRAIGKNNHFGLSARGIAVNTGLPSGEQFPSFTEFWLIRPNAKADTLTLYALLDGRSLTGAYQFDIRLGDAAVMDVKSRLFIRNDIEKLGVAPLTSMFFYGGNTARPVGEWRPRVHDSDGLLMHDGGSGEWLWRPLLNPKNLKIDYFSAAQVQGFGLMQRQTRFDDFQDFGAHYHERPSAWVQPKGEWGKGRVSLVQLPSNNEVNNNIVAFWTPDEPVRQGQTLAYDYQLKVGAPTVSGSDRASAVKTFVGDGNRAGGGNVEGAYRIVVDFAGGPLKDVPGNAPVTSDVIAEGDGEVIEHFVEFLAPVNRWRVSILARPAADQPLSLRAFLKKGEDTVSETWSYEIPVNNDILGGDSR